MPCVVYSDTNTSKTLRGGGIFLESSKKASYPNGRRKKDRTISLSLDLVLAAEHVVHLSEIVSAGLQSLHVARGLEVLLQVGILAQLAHVIVRLGGEDSAGVQAVLEVQLLNHVGDIADNLGAEHGSGQTTAVAEKTNSLGLARREGDVADQASQTRVDGSGVHVTAESGDLKTRLHTLGEALLGQGHEGLLDGLISQGCSIVEIAQLRGDLGESGVRGVREVVVVKHTAVRLLHKLASRGMEQDVVEAVQGGLGLLNDSIGAILIGLEDLLAGIVGLVASVDRLSVALERELAVHHGVLAGEVRLIEVVGVGKIRAAKTGLDDNGGIRTDQHSHTASTTSGTSSTLGVQGNITADDNGITTVPGGRLEPVETVEDGVGTTVAGIDSVDTLNVGVAVWGKQLHQDRLDRLGLVQKGLSADLEAADGLGVDVVLVHEGGEGG